MFFHRPLRPLKGAKFARTNTHYHIIQKALKFEPKRILLTGGLGDFFAIECFISDLEREEIRTVVHGCCYAKAISSLMALLPNYHIKNEIFLWENLKTRPCRNTTVQLRGHYNDITNLNFWRVVANIRLKKRVFNKSSFIEHDLNCDLSKFNLPKEYVCIAPYTESEHRRHPRNYTKEDWMATVGFLSKVKIPGVVLGTKICDYQSPDLIDLGGKTSILESIEILKKASGFIGIDSFLSILAAKLFDDILLVKTVASHVFHLKHVYFATSKSPPNSFLQRKIQTKFLL
jgi:hypothetical protein